MERTAMYLLSEVGSGKAASGMEGACTGANRTLSRARKVLAEWRGCWTRGRQGEREEKARCEWKDAFCKVEERLFWNER